MNLNKKIFKTEVDGSELELEVSELAGQANAAIIGRWGETVVLATVVMGKNDSQADYFPLSVDYEERFYAAGKIIGSRFIRREGRPSDEAILSGRLIDRSIRPLFDSRLRRDIQVVVTVLAYDEAHDPDLIALVSASTALGISEVPWSGPVGGARFNKKNSDGSIIYNAFFSGTDDRINMIELEGNEISENDANSLFLEAQEKIKKLVDFQKNVIKEIGKKKIEIGFAPLDSRVKNLVTEFLKGTLSDAIKNKSIGELKSNLLSYLKSSSENSDVIKSADAFFEDSIDNFVHTLALEHDERPDGRRLDEVRSLFADSNIFKRTHGSALFIRGTTQVLAITTLAAPSAEQLVETMETTGKKRFMLHYNFPGFSVGEIGRQKGPGRREIGHGELAAKAIRALIPSKDEFPYAIRVVAETLSSNGSSSMATTCATSVSLMDAGVPMKKHVAGIAMGLMSDKGGKYKILTDIQGPEDHHGDMDFKVAGTEDGITAMQMDVKIDGITKDIFEKTLSQAKKARLEIIQVMKQAMPEYKKEVSKYAPTILKIKIPQDRIGEVIGPGGKVIHGIIAATGGVTSIDIEEDGTVYVSSEDRLMAEKALAFVQDIVKEYTIGEVLRGKVIKILDFGAIVGLNGKQDGMVHVSELKDGYVKNVEDVVKLGDTVNVKIVKVENGRIGLSMKGVKQE